MSAAIWIESLIKHFPELIEELVPAHRPHDADRARPPARRTRQDRQEALDNQRDHGFTSLNTTQSPLELFVSDTIRDITDGVLELEEAVREKLALGPVPPAPVPHRLLRIAAFLDRIEEHPLLAAHVLDETRRMARRCARALGDPEQMVRLPGRCPWCDSVSLRAFPERGAVLCVNPACRCDRGDCPCGTDPAHRHSWSEDESPATAGSGR